MLHPRSLSRPRPRPRAMLPIALPGRPDAVGREREAVA